MDKAQKEKEEKEEKEKEEVLKEEEDVDLWETAPVALKEEAEGFHTGLLLFLFLFLFFVLFFVLFFSGCVCIYSFYSFFF